jgi:hypothetical protein
MDWELARRWMDSKEDKRRNKPILSGSFLLPPPPLPLRRDAAAVNNHYRLWIPGLLFPGVSGMVRESGLYWQVFRWRIEIRDKEQRLRTLLLSYFHNTRLTRYIDFLHLPSFISMPYRDSEIRVIGTKQGLT